MLRIDNEICIGCGVCEETCSFDAITLVDDKPQVNDKCTLCGACVEACEAGALSIEREEKASVEDLTSWSGVWVYAEYRNGRIAPVVFELLGEGRKLADKRGTKLSAVFLGSGMTSQADQLIANGADIVYVIDNPALADFTDESYGNVLEDLIRAKRPEIFLAGATAIGRSLVPRVATLMATGLTADCTSLDIREEDGALLQTRPAFGGNIMATIVCPYTRPQMATVRPMVMRPLAADKSRQGEVVIIASDPGRLKSRVKVLKSVVVEPDRIKLTEADIVV